MQLGHYGYQAELFSDIESITSAIKYRPPDILITDIMLSEGVFTGINFVTEIRRDTQYESPVIFLSSQSDFEARLEAVRAGGDAYYIKPVDTTLLVDRLDGLTKHQLADPYRILIVDNDATPGRTLRVNT